MDADDGRPIEYTGYTGSTGPFHALCHGKIQHFANEPFAARTEKQRVWQFCQFAEMLRGIYRFCSKSCRIQCLIGNDVYRG